MTLTTSGRTLDTLCVNTIRCLAIDGVQQANSGHPGMPLGATPMAYTIWDKFLKVNPKNPRWANRDRFVLSPGHGSMLIYSLLHLYGYGLPMDELKRFRQWGSKTPGHPEFGHTVGLETTTGPLGQGFANAVGMALAERWLASHFNRPGHDVVDHYTYAIVSDGDLEEGVTSEAASLAGTLKLGKVIFLYDDNRISIEGSTDTAFTENAMLRFDAYGWHVQKVEGEDLAGIEQCIRNAQAVTDRPSIIAVHTHLAYASPLEDRAEAHGSPLGVENVKKTKEKLGFPSLEPFFVPDEARAHFAEKATQGAQWEKEWNERFARYAAEFPDLAKEWDLVVNQTLPAGWDTDVPTFAEGGEVATRAASGKVLNALAQRIPHMVGGAADLAPSTETWLKGYPDVRAGQYNGRNFHFGVREHGMGSVTNGMVLHGLKAYCAGFLIFSSYMIPPVRYASMMKIPTVFVYTHDSIGLGEDGPTHQPIESLTHLRSIPDNTVIRPADATETAEAWKLAIQRKVGDGPVCLIFSRQKLKVLDRKKYAAADNLKYGAYVLQDCQGTPDVLLIGSGSEVGLCVEAAEKLTAEGKKVRIVSMPSWELFERQPQSYKDQVLPPSVRARVTVEALTTMGWHRYAGDAGRTLGLDHYGASAPADILFREFGFTADNVVRLARESIVAANR